MSLRSDLRIKLVALALAMGGMLSLSHPVAHAAFPGDNGRFVYVDVNYWQIFSSEQDGSDPQQLTDTGHFTEAPMWSPDGQRIVYMQDTTFTENFDIFVMNGDGSNEVNLTNNSTTSERSPSWSPSGQWIVFSRTVSTAPTQLWVIRSDGSGLRRITRTDRYHHEPAWSPTGRWILFNEDDSSLWVTGLLGNERQLTSGFADKEAAWSPDGEWIVFVRHVNTNRSLYVIRPDGTGLRRLTAGPGDTHPAWSPDGTKIAFTRPGNGGNGDVFVIDLPTRTITNATNTSDVDEWDVDWQPVQTGGR